MSPQPVAAAGLQGVVNRLLDLDPELAEGVAELEGSVLEVHVHGFEWRFQMHVSSGGVEVVPVDEREHGVVVAPDLTISGPPVTLLRLLGSLESVDGVLPPDVSISGDLHLVEKLARLAKRADIDWEEPVSRILGDPFAHEIGRGVRAALSWTRMVSETVAIDVGEFLREERRLSPTGIEVDDFSAEVDMVRDDVERLAVRIGRLADRLRSSRH